MRHRSTGRGIAAWTSALLALSAVTPVWAQLGAGAGCVGARLTAASSAGTTSASNWAPLRRSSFASASSALIAPPYGRSTVMATKAAAAWMIRASRLISSRGSPAG